MCVIDFINNGENRRVFIKIDCMVIIKCFYPRDDVAKERDVSDV